MLLDPTILPPGAAMRPKRLAAVLKLPIPVLSVFTRIHESA
jgi:hypothetical protein